MTDWADNRIFDRYIDALVSLKKTDANLKKWLVNAASLNTALNNHPKLLLALTNPTIGQRDKESVIRDISKILKFDALFLQTILVFFKQGRSALIEGLTTRMITELQKEMGVVKTQVTSAQKMTPSQKKNLINNLGQSTDIESIIDPDILGGLIIQIGSWRMDDSVKGKIERLTHKLETAV